ncbi:NAD(P)-dependent oxidoreductase, partial [Actinacidiphila rubida]
RHDPGEAPLTRYVATPLVRRVFGRQYADLAVMEDVLRDSGLDWTAVRPPRLTGRPLSGAYRTAYGCNVRGGMTVARADVAHCMLRALEDPGMIRRAVGIAD